MGGVLEQIDFTFADLFEKVVDYVQHDTSLLMRDSAKQ
jgi:hypothetical protein